MYFKNLEAFSRLSSVSSGLASCCRRMRYVVKGPNAVNLESVAPSKVNVLLGTIGLLLATKGVFAEGLQRLVEGEQILRETHQAFDLANLLCSKCEAELLAKNPISARNSVAEAEAIAKRLGLPTDAQVSKRIRKLRRELGEPGT